MTHELESLEQLQRAIASRLVGAQPASCDQHERSLTAIDADELKRSSRTLKRKRLTQTAALLPITRSLLGAAFDEAFLQYANEVHCNGPRAIFRDGAEFFKWLRMRLDAIALPNGLRREFLAECCRFEGGLCDWQASAWILVRERFAWDWRGASIGAGHLAEGDFPRRSTCRWLWRIGPWVGGRMWG
jgi:hypothetical protein